MKKSRLSGVIRFRTILPMILAIAFTSQAKASIVLNQGDVLVSEFTDPDLRGIYNSSYFVRNTGPSVGLLYFRLAPDHVFSEGSQMFVELFESDLEEEPVHSESIYGELSGLLKTEAVINLWSDQQGAVRLTMIAGAVVFDTISATYSPTGVQKYVGEIDFTAAAVPIPATAWLFGSGILGLIGIARYRKAP